MPGKQADRNPRQCKKFSVRLTLDVTLKGLKIPRTPDRAEITNLDFLFCRVALESTWGEEYNGEN